MNTNFFNISPRLAFLDLAIIVGYLTLTIVVGFYYGRGIKSFKDFAVGSKRFSVSVLTMTIFATIVSGLDTVGYVGKIYDSGILFFFAVFGYVIYQFIAAYYIAPRIVQFKEALSLGDLMEKKFGLQGRFISGFLVALRSIGSLGAQLTALGIFLEYLLGIGFIPSIVISSLIIIAYAAYGGVNSVVMTDVLQFFVLAIALPVCCLIGVNYIGGYEVILAKTPEKTFAITWPSLLYHVSLFFVLAIPQMGPGVVQRMLLSKDSHALSKAFRFSALLHFPFYAIMFVFALTALSCDGNIKANFALPYMIDNFLPVGIKGLAIAGMMAVIMSTADTTLNASCVFLINDCIKPCFKKTLTTQHDLLFSRLITVVFGIVSIATAIYYNNVFDSWLFGQIFWTPLILVPLYAVLFSLPGDLQDFYRAAIAGIATFLVWSFLPLPMSNGESLWLSLEKATYINSLLPAFIMNGIVFFRGKPLAVIKQAWLKERKMQKEILHYERSFFGLEGSLAMWFAQKTHDAKAPYGYVGVLGVAMFLLPLFYFDLSQNDNLLITLKIIAGLLMWGLMLRGDWLSQKGLWFCVYWHISALATFIIIPCLAYIRCAVQDQYIPGVLSAGQFDNFLMLVLSGIALSFVLHKYLTSIHTLIAVVFCACVSYAYTGAFLTRPVFQVLYFFFILNILCYMLSGRIAQLKDKSIKMHSNHAVKMALETASPLVAQGMTVKAAKDALRDLLQECPDVAEHKQIKCLNKELDILYRRNTQISKFLHMYQLTVQEKKQKQKPYRIEMQKLVQDMVEALPFSDTFMRSMLHVSHHKDFVFTTLMPPELMCNVIHNLVRNGYDAILKREDGEKSSPRIDVEFEHKGRDIQISVRDNGCGMTSLQQHRIFNEFFTTKLKNIGVGLAFCKDTVEAAGGGIVCTSIYGQGSCFTLLIPIQDSCEVFSPQDNLQKHL